MQRPRRRPSYRRTRAAAFIVAFAVSIVSHHISGIMVVEAATPGSGRASCPPLKCSAHPMTSTPFRTSAVTFESGRLCLHLDTDRQGKFGGACRTAGGPTQLYVSVPDATVKDPAFSSTLLRKTSYPAAQYTHPRCQPGIGISSMVQRQSGSALVVKRGYPASFCYTYTPSTPFRQIAVQTDKKLTKPVSQPCCSPTLGFTAPQTSIQLQAATKTKTGFGCLGCSLQGVFVSKANAQGYVWQDNDQNSKYSANIDSGFEGVVVNLYRAVGSALTFLGCANTDGTGFYKFAGLVPDTYVLEVVKPAVVAGGMYSFQFATPGQGSVVNSAGRTSASFYLASTTTVRNALLQVVFA